jgi:cyclohexadienyl dehydratase
MQRRFVRPWLRTIFSAAILIAPVASAVAGGVPGALRVGTSADYAPFSFRDRNGDLTGFDIVVAQRLASDLGRQIAFVPFRWPDLVAQLESGAFDVAMSGVTIRPDRATQIAYTRPYVVTGAVAVIRGSDKRRYRSVGDLDHARVRLGVNAGGHLEQVTRKRFPHAHVTLASNNRGLPDLLRRGKLDAVISEELEARTWPVKQFVILGPFTRDRKAYAVASTFPDLLQQINDWLAAREADGWLNEQRRRWLGEGATLSPAQAGFEALVTAIDLRLQLMPFVAAVKRREHLPIEDPVQEARVLERVRATATKAGLNADDVTELFRTQIDIAKTLERSAASVSVAADVSLAQLRVAVGRASDQIITELSRCQPWLGETGGHGQLEGALHQGLTGVEPNVATRIGAALRRVRRAKREPHPSRRSQKKGPPQGER